jgi:hypothetical protein
MRANRGLPGGPHSHAQKLVGRLKELAGQRELAQFTTCALMTHHCLTGEFTRCSSSRRTASAGTDPAAYHEQVKAGSIHGVQELIVLYARRWDTSLLREGKRQLRQSDVFAKPHPWRRARRKSRRWCGQRALGTGAHADGGRWEAEAVLQVSFIKTLELMRPLWLTPGAEATIVLMIDAARRTTGRKRFRPCLNSQLMDSPPYASGAMRAGW